MNLYPSNAIALASMSEAALAVGESVAALVPAVEHFGRQLYALAWDAYLKAGAPYGETPEGMNQWLNEREEIDS